MSLLLFATQVLAADIYKCNEHGNTVFSDQPCSDQAEKLALKLRQPQQQDIAKQQQLTATFEEESRINQIHLLNDKNAELEQQIKRLQQAQQAELEALAEKTYQTEDGRIATKEHGLFDRMDQLVEDYQQQIKKRQAEIKTNEKLLSALHQKDPKKRVD